MGYLTTKQAAEKWGLTSRRVQEMCHNGDINGVVRRGRVWLIPDDAENTFGVASVKETRVKPISVTDQRIYSGITDIYKIPGSADKIVSALTDDFSRDVFASQLAFYRGDFEKSLALAEKHFDESETGVAYRAAIGMQMMLAPIATGDLAVWKKGYKYIEEAECDTEPAEAVRSFYLAAGACAVSDASHFPEWLKRGDFSPLPRQSYPAACYNYVKYLYTVCHDEEQRGEHQSAIELMRNMPLIVEPMISMVSSENVIIMEIYLRLLCALAYHVSGRDEYAVSHIDKALELAMPDRLYTPIAEYRRRFGFLVDDRIAEKCAFALPEIKRISKQLNDGWVALFNRHMGRQVTNRLSPREWQAARLATYGLSNKEISERMGITVNAVKQTIRLVMDKTGAESRSEISKYI